jgi:His-Xaa-Ser system protein HxsD
MYTTSLSVSKGLYPSQVVLKTAYAFIDEYYVHIDENQNQWIIEIRSKKSDDDKDLRGQLENELISQSVRYAIFKRTRNIRELILARAMSSTMIDTNNGSLVEEYGEDAISDEELDTILTSWFDSYD